MKLRDAVERIETLDGAATLFVRQPWTPESDTALAVEGSVEEERVRGEGMSYFLEVVIAKDFLIGWRDSKRKAPGVEQSCLRLIEYAANAA